jgi:hypothetical protein
MTSLFMMMNRYPLSLLVASIAIVYLIAYFAGVAIISDTLLVSCSVDQRVTIWILDGLTPLHMVRTLLLQITFEYSQYHTDS